MDYLDHIADAAGKIESYLEGMEKEVFLKDERTQHAVVFNLIVIGESANKLFQKHSAFTEKHADMYWAVMKGIRNRIAHSYFDIDLDVVWETAQTSIPEMRIRLPAVMASAEAER